MDVLDLIIIVLLILLIGIFLIANYFFNYAFTRNGLKKNVDRLAKSDGIPSFNDFKRNLDPGWWSKHKAKRITINSFDGLKLSALYVKNDTYTKNIVIFSHGYSATAGSMMLYAPTYYKLGYDIISVDNRAHGKSEGNIVGMANLDSKDMMRWIDKAKEIKGEDCKIVLHGVSMGASTMCSISNNDIERNVKCIISDCAYDNAANVYTHLLKAQFKLPKFPMINTLNLICKIRGKYYLSKTDIINSVKNSKVPILYIHGSEDTFVPVYMAENLYNATPKDKRDILIIDGASHAASVIINNDKYFKKVEEWIKKYVQ